MYLRQVAANFVRRMRVSSQRTSYPPRAMNHNPLPNPLPSEVKWTHKYRLGCSSWFINHGNPHVWAIIAAQVAIILGINENLVSADATIEGISSSENDSEETSIAGLRKIEDGSVVSNIHTSKWRVFTDKAREFFLQGKLAEAEKLFFSAIQEAKEGFGERDPHVASACNNLAELYRVKKELDKAEPLYLEAIDILEEAFGPEDVRVGAALHNFGQFYLFQRKLEDARKCYERALKIKGRVLGYNNPDYADTMYHLGTVLYLLGKEKDAEVLIWESIRILEENGLEESVTSLRRLRYLAQIYLKSNNLAEAENVQRKILHIMELSKGWNSLETVIAAEGLALTLLSIGNLKESEELLERCLEARKTLLPEDHIQITANMLELARVAMLKSNRLQKMNIAAAIVELDKAKDLLHNSIRIAQKILNKVRKQLGNKKKNGASSGTVKQGHTALIILLQSLDVLGDMEMTKRKLNQSMGKHLLTEETEKALFQCISTYKEVFHGCFILT
uniref:Uncharacterized protein n=1 Tax=Rhizophora mucronata TaxID=61149 RepID=A0A2P2L011_RHIMU